MGELRDLFQDLPGEYFRAQSFVPKAHFLRTSNLREVYIIKRSDLARNIAETIVRDDRFFRVEEDLENYGFRVDIDARVMTTRELKDALVAAYRAGVEGGPIGGICFRPTDGEQGAAGSSRGLGTTR